MQNKDDSSKQISTQFLYNFIQIIGGKDIVLKEVTLQSQDFYCLGFNSDRTKIVKSTFPQAKIFNQNSHCLVLLPLDEAQKVFFDYFNKSLKKIANSMAWGEVETSAYPCLINKTKFDLIKTSMKNAKDLLNLGLAIGSYVETPPISSFTMYGALVSNGSYKIKYYICIERWQKFVETNVLEAFLAEVAQRARYNTLKKIIFYGQSAELAFVKTKLDHKGGSKILSSITEYANSTEDAKIGLTILSEARDKNNDNNNTTMALVDLYPDDGQFSKEIEQKKETLKKKRSGFFSLHPKRKEHKELFLDLLHIFKKAQPNFSLQKHLKIISTEDPQFYQLACEGNTSETKILLDNIANHTYSSPST